MVRHHHRIAFAVALTLALAAGPAAARLQLNPPPGTVQPSASASTNLCSEVCSAGGYTATARRADALAERGATLPHDPRPRSEALAVQAPGSGSGSIAGSGPGGPRSEVVSGHGYSRPGGSALAHVTAPAGGFDWGDAGIGAGGALAVTMLLIGGILAAPSVRRRAGRSTAQPTA